MVRTLVMFFVATLGLLAQINMAVEEGIVSVVADETTWTPLLCPLSKAKFVQVIIDPEGTDQIFKLRNAGTQIVFKVPEGGSYEIFLRDPGCQLGQTLWEAQTAVSSTTLQIIGQREGR